MSRDLSPPPRLTRERKSADERRAQIIEAATQLIAERGFWGVTLRDAAVLCGITEAGVLHHFQNKARLLIAVLEYRDEADFQALAKLLGLSRADIDLDPLPASLRQLCTALITRNVAQPEIVRLYSVLNAEALEPTHPAYAYFQQREDMALSLFARSLRDVDNADHVARQVLAVMDGLQLRWLRKPDRIDLLEEWDSLFERAFAHLGPQGGDSPPAG
ncbi:TetR/AcrR family transcriptional regulator [Pleomorphomonas sp. PLEO]|uniref:TetR/AcrR family transcriptional regulator n=1 Tax=Pleomorphomonas sp. PLEO TaxID=3239306 RepID=UPI00351E0301